MNSNPDGHAMYRQCSRCPQGFCWMFDQGELWGHVLSVAEEHHLERLVHVTGSSWLCSITHFSPPPWRHAVLLRDAGFAVKRRTRHHRRRATKCGLRIEGVPFWLMQRKADRLTRCDRQLAPLRFWLMPVAAPPITGKARMTGWPWRMAFMSGGSKSNLKTQLDQQMWWVFLILIYFDIFWHV